MPLPALYLEQSNSISAALEEVVQKVCSTQRASEKSTEKTSQTMHGVFFGGEWN